MTTEAQVGKGATFEIHNDDGDPGTWTELAEIIDITPPAASREAVDATHYASEAMENIAGFLDWGEGSVTVNWVPGGATDTLINAVFGSGAVRRMRFDNIPAAGGQTLTWSFDAFITSVTPAAPLKDRMTMAIGLRTSGAPDKQVA